MKKQDPEKLAETKARLAALMRSLNREDGRRTVVVVEGDRDEEAIRALGYRGEVFRLCACGRSYSGLLSASENCHRTVLLTDYDRKGSYMLHRASRMLQGKGLVVDTWLRKRIRQITEGQVDHIEELGGFAT
ncbi:MAG: hypothetical protein JRN39_01375 [Nitrososphaerota archaeon]|nr:hypothetical protein [Nitrososphaerota archaeon]